MAPTKDPAAQSMGRKRWKGKTKAEKTAHAEMMTTARLKVLTPERRKEIARNAIRARWGAPRKKTTKARSPK